MMSNACLLGPFNYLIATTFQYTFKNILSGVLLMCFMSQNILRAESNVDCVLASGDSVTVKEWLKISLYGETKQRYSSSGHICECLSFTFFNFVLYLSHSLINTA